MPNQVAGPAGLPERRRPGYFELPLKLRLTINEWLGGEVTAASSIPYGFSPGVVAKIEVSGGRRLFIKSLTEAVNAEAAFLYRAEIAACLSMPEPAGGQSGRYWPALLWSHDADGHITMIFEYVDGSPPHTPWRPEDLRRALSAVAGFATVRATSPMRDISEVYGDRFTGWRDLAGLAVTDSRLGRLDPWARARLSQLAGLEAGWARGGPYDSFLHGDLRSDNMLFTRDEVVLVDWAWACTGPAWFDLMMMLPSVRLEGGPEPAEVFDASAVAKTADPAEVTSMLAALTGFFVRQSLLSAPPGIVALREFQADQGEVALGWLKQRLSQ